MGDRNNIPAHALALTRFGWHVFPVHWAREPGRCSCRRGTTCNRKAKHPLVQQGVLEATVDPGLLGEWWAEWPEANIGVATGAISGIIVVDVDSRHDGPQSIRVAMDLYGRPPPTVVAITGDPLSRHIYWRHPGVRVKNATGLRKGVDLRGDGGYVIAPPSGHESGRRYTWHPEGTPGKVKVQNAPDWIFEDLVDNRRETKTRRYRYLKDDQAIIAEGHRNDTLASLAGRLVWENKDYTQVIAKVIAVNEARCRPPLSDHEARKIADGIFRRYQNGAKQNQR